MNRILNGASAIVIFILLLTGSADAERYVVQKGDTLSYLLQDYFTFSEVNRIAQERKTKHPSEGLKAGMLAEKGSDSFALLLSPDKEVKISRTPLGGADVALITYPTDTLTTLIQGEITSNLFNAVIKVGESAELAQSLAQIFEWEIDFLKDLRRGDSFKIVVEKRFVRGKFLGYGRILAAEFDVHKGRHYAFWYKAGSKYGYFNESGNPLERGFLRVPLPYGKITSRFTDSRLHPITQKYQPHYGVDYAAPIGTPVMAAASGAVVKKSFTERNGYYIELRHSNGYHTFYLHLNGFNNSIKEGSYVKQGQVVGYVGKTGMATGAHLDYRIRYKDKWLNPLNFIAESPVFEQFDKKEFALTVDRYSKMMNLAALFALNTRPTILP
ncbi:MAG: M23 family metallopeptidase [Deferribacteraceae bacterium]|nr:M23 family metallopeptidase [Deferribacteraceae bacterium]